MRAGMIALAVTTALVQAPPAAARDGAAVWAAACARCHRSAGQLVPAIPATPANRAAWLDGFLAKHHARDAADRAAVIAWLLSQAKE